MAGLNPNIRLPGPPEPEPFTEGSEVIVEAAGEGGDIPHFTNFSDAIRENKPLNSPISDSSSE